MTKQNQKSGDNSLNVQSTGDVSIHTGITFSDARDIALDVYKQNAMECVGVAQEEAMRRVNLFASELLTKMESEFKEGVESFSNPDMQALLLDAQTAYARSGEEEKKNVLIDLVLERSKNAGAPKLKDAILNEAVKVAAKLTQNQLKILTATFLTRHTVSYSANLEEFKTQVLDGLIPFIEDVDNGELNYRHLEYMGCLSVQVGRVDFFNKLGEKYTAFFTKGFEAIELEKLLDGIDLGGANIPCFQDDTKVQIGILSESHIDGILKRESIDSQHTAKIKSIMKKNIMSKAEISNFVKNYHSSLDVFFNVVEDNKCLFSNSLLTSVGRCIALSNLHAHGRTEYQFDTWLNPKS